MNNRKAVHLACLLGCCLSFLVYSIAQASNLHVDPNSPTNGPGTALDWSNAFHTIQSAVAVANSGDFILVAGGTYKPANQNSTIDLADGVSIKGGYAGYGAANPDDRNPDLYVSILSGDISGNDDPNTPSTHYENARSVVFVPDGVQPPPNQSASDFADRANLDGFTITAAYITGGINMNTSGSPAPSAIIRNCKIRGNHSAYSGGGLYVGDGASMVLRRCEINENNADEEGGALAMDGEVKLIDCWVHDNSTYIGDGGAIKCRGTVVALTVVSSTIDHNQTTANGGAFSCKSASGTIKLINSNCFGNSASGLGGAIEILSSGIALEMTNCTVSDNSAYQGGGIYLAGSVSFIKNSIVWGNTATNHPDIWNSAGSLTVDHSDIAGGWTGTGNKNVDPLFVDPSNGNYRLLCASLCLDQADNNVVPVDTEDADENHIMTGEDAPDLDLAMRIQNSTVDMGAYERGSEAPCAADTNGDGTVNVTDLLAVINAWGSCSSCPADVAPVSGCTPGDGSVNVTDLLAVISAWGPVPLYCGSTTGALHNGATFPTSISDCFNVFCVGLSGQEWEDCINKCVEAVCQNNPSECE